MLTVMIHAEKNGNSSFEPAVELPVESKFGGPIISTIKINLNAAEDVPLSI